MIEETQKCFIQILQDHLNGKVTDFSNFSIDSFKSIISYARIHQVEGIVYQQCKNRITESTINSLA